MTTFRSGLAQNNTIPAGTQRNKMLDIEVSFDLLFIETFRPFHGWKRWCFGISPRLSRASSWDSVRRTSCFRRQNESRGFVGEKEVVMMPSPPSFEGPPSGSSVGLEISWFWKSDIGRGRLLRS